MSQEEQEHAIGSGRGRSAGRSGFKRAFVKYFPDHTRSLYLSFLFTSTRYLYKPNQQYQNPYYPNRGNINNQQNTSITLKSLENMRSRGLISEENYLKKLKELGF